MTEFDCDLFVIGAGSGGVRASRIAATHGAKVIVAEDWDMGGTCVNVGCVPKKLFVYGSHYAHDFEEAAAFGWDLPANRDIPVDWGRLISNKNEEISRLNGIYSSMLGKAGVEVVRARASVSGKQEVSAGGKVYKAKKILVATGSWPFVPSFPGSEFVITSNEAFHIPSLPKRAVIVGGGYIAVEFACIFKGYGVEVTQMYRGELFLRGFDIGVREHLSSQMTDQGIDLRFNTDPVKIERLDSGAFVVTCQNGEVVETDLVMYATGRIPKSKDIGLETVGVEMGSKGEIKVDEFSKTNIDSIFAVGDVTDRMNLTPVALAEGHCFADTEFGGKSRSASYELVPTAVFSQPPIGTCGLTEEEADKKYGADDIDIYKTSFRALKHTLTKSKERDFMKLIVQRSTDLVVGVHLVDPSAGDMIQLAGVAMRAGATKADFDNTIGVHPTSAEELVTMRTKSER